MTKKRYNRLANVMLGGAFIGLSASYPFHASFSGGLISSMCSSALIGGIADWFAITALFRRPFRIPPGKLIRTEIIPQNRERLLNSLADMVEDELLTKETLGQRIETYDFANLMINFLQSRSRETADFSLRFVKTISTHVDTANLSHLVEMLFARSTTPEQAGILVGRALEFLVASGYDEQLVLLLRREIVQLIERPEAKPLVREFVGNVLSDFSSGNFLRKAVLMMLPSPEQITESVLNYVKGLTPEQMHAWIKQSLPKFILDVKTNPKIQREVSFFLRNLGGTIIPRLSSMLANSVSEPSEIIEMLSKHGKAYLAKFENDLAGRSKLNRFAQKGALSLLDKHHHKLHRLVLNRLSCYTDEEIVDLIESKAGEDLQIIRITGALVGGAVGSLLFVMSYMFY